MSGPHAEQPVPLSAQLAQYYTLMLGQHRNDRDTGACRQCGYPTCDTWRNAKVALISAGIKAR